MFKKSVFSDKLTTGFLSSPLRTSFPWEEDNIMKQAELRSAADLKNERIWRGGNQRKAQTPDKPARREKNQVSE